jgi:Abortive infection C-terminus
VLIEVESFTIDYISGGTDPVAALPLERGERALAFRNGLISEATGSSIDNAVYRLLRSEFMADPATAKLLPKFIKTCADSGDFWQFIKYEFSTYRERRDYLRNEFSALIGYLETNYAPATEGISDVLETFDMEGVGGAWRKALDRVSNDPEGAITAARTLIETVCKHILDEGVEPATKYSNGDDLPKLYALVSKELNLAPSQHTEGVFKQILGGCTAVVEGLGALRNRVGDAHGQGKRPVKVNARHATLAVNLAGATTTFIVETFNSRNND